MPQPDFWATSAQTMPVFALALIVEARVIMRGWVPGRAWFGKSLQGLVWAISLAIYALAEPACFRALAGEQVWSGWPGLIQFGVQIGTTALLLSPAIEVIVRSNARTLVRLSPRSVQNYWLTTRSRLSTARSFRRMSKKVGKIQAWRASALRELDDLEADFRELPESEKRTAGLAEIAERRADILAQMAEGAELLKEIDDLNKDHRSTLSEFRTRRQKILTDAEASLAQWPAPPTDDRN